MAKLIVALLLSVGLANGLANFGGSTCELDSDYKERFEKLEDRIEEMMGVVEGMMGVVESIASKPCCEGTAQPTVTPPELNGCGEPCADVVTLDEAAIAAGTTEFTGDYFTDIEPDTCYVVDGQIWENGGVYSPSLKVEVSCAKITVLSGSRLNGILARLPRPSFAPQNAETRRAQVYGDNAMIVNEGEVNGIRARFPRPLLSNSLCGPSTTPRRSTPQPTERRSRTTALVPPTTASATKSEFSCALRPPPGPPKTSTTPPSRAGPRSGGRYRGDRPGPRPHLRARPASIAPARPRATEFERRPRVHTRSPTSATAWTRRCPLAETRPAAGRCRRPSPRRSRRWASD